MPASRLAEWSNQERGSELLSVAAEHPLAPYAGMFKDNPLFDAWQQAIDDYRREMDAEPEGS